MTKEEIYTVLTLFTLMGVVEKPSLNPFLMNHLIVRPSFFVSFLDRSEIIFRILQFIDNSADTFKDHRNYSQFLTLYLPEKPTSTDESLTLCNSCPSFK
jgi:hypothetical protein